MRKTVKNIIKYLLIAIVSAIVLVFGINFIVTLSSSGRILPPDSEFQKADCILVLGAGVWGNSPSHMLADRLDTAIELYKSGAADKIIMSGDHGRQEYDEVNIMKAYAIEKGVPSDAIFMDHAGFSTYDSVYRAKAIFEAEKVIIVSQKYHLYRALYIAKALGISSVGANADKRIYIGENYRQLREVLARDKDFVMCIFRPKPTFLGDSVPVTGNGNITNDENSKNYFSTGE